MSQIQRLPHLFVAESAVLTVAHYELTRILILLHVLEHFDRFIELCFAFLLALLTHERLQVLQLLVEHIFKLLEDRAIRCHVVALCVILRLLACFSLRKRQ